MKPLFQYEYNNEDVYLTTIDGVDLWRSLNYIYCVSSHNTYESIHIDSSKDTLALKQRVGSARARAYAFLKYKESLKDPSVSPNSQ